MTSHRNDRVLFVWLLLAGLLGSLVGVPYTVAVLMDPAAGGPIDPRLAWLSALAEALFLLAPASAVGVWLGNKVGLGPRLLRELVSKVPGGWERVRGNLKTSMIVGFTMGVLGLAQYLIPQSALGPGLQNPTAFECALRSLSAALTEEILFRLGLMTSFVWAIRSIVKKPAFHVPSLWIGNALAALLFAGGHLPHTADVRDTGLESTDSARDGKQPGRNYNGMAVYAEWPHLSRSRSLHRRRSGLCASKTADSDRMTLIEVADALLALLVLRQSPKKSGSDG